MKCLIVFISLASLLYAGQSTPSYSVGQSGFGSTGYAPVGYQGPLAKTIVPKDGYIADTPEVTAAKNLHYSAVHKAQAEAAAHGYSRNGDDGSNKYGADYASEAGYSPLGYRGLLAKTVVLKDGHIADTPEVAAAKHLHYSAVHKAQAEAAAHGYSRNGDDGSNKYGADYKSDAGYASVGYHGPIAKTVVLKDGHIADTPEVAAAKNLHYSAVHMAQAEAGARGYSGDGDDGSNKYSADYESDARYAPVGYRGPFAKTVVPKDGHIADTPEVAAAKNLHYSAVHKAQAEAAARGYSGDGDNFSYKYSADYASDAGYAPVGYSGPLAKTVVLKDGHPSDTPEVTAAKNLHYSAVHKAQAEAAARGYSGDGNDDSSKYGANYESDAGYESEYAGSFGYGLGSYHRSGAGYGGSYDSGARVTSSYMAYSGPLAYTKVLPSGLLAETHEVNAAKQAHLNAVAVTAREHAEKWRKNYYH